MKDIAVVIKNLLGGADAKTVRKVGTVVVDAMSAVHGTKYVLIPASDAKTLKGSVKKARRWARFVDSIDYDARANGFAIKGDWANVFDLTKEQEGRIVIVSIPNVGLYLGKIDHDAEVKGAWDSGKEWSVKGLGSYPDKPFGGFFDEGDYAGIIEKCKAEGVAAFSDAA